MTDKTVCIILADGFEETEALMPADILKRLNINVILAGLETYKIRGAHDFHIITETLLQDISAADFDALILPGGLPGTLNLRDSQAVTDLINQAYNNKKICAAICAAPIVLRDAGVAVNKRITGYPSTEQLSHNPDFRYTGNDVEHDGQIITAKGMGKAAAFAFEIARTLGISEDKINGVMQNAFITL